MTSKIVRKAKSSVKNVTRKYESKKMDEEQVLEVEREGWWVYVLLLSTIVILAQSLKDYTFSFDNVTLTYSIFIIPIIYFVTNFITKKYGYSKSIIGISISSILLGFNTPISSTCSFLFNRIQLTSCIFILLILFT